MEQRTARALTGAFLVSIMAGTVYGVSILLPPTLVSEIAMLSGSASVRFLAASIFVSLELLGVAMVKKSDRFAISSVVVLVAGVLLGYFVF
jgi:hypothetical protein